MMEVLIVGYTRINVCRGIRQEAADRKRGFMLGSVRAATQSAAVRSRAHFPLKPTDLGLLCATGSKTRQGDCWSLSGGCRYTQWCEGSRKVTSMFCLVSFGNRDELWTNQGHSEWLQMKDYCRLYCLVRNAMYSQRWPWKLPPFRD
jgi:hypothetical protein